MNEKLLPPFQTNPLLRPNAPLSDVARATASTQRVSDFPC